MNCVPPGRTVGACSVTQERDPPECVPSPFGCHVPSDAGTLRAGGRGKTYSREQSPENEREAGRLKHALVAAKVKLAVTQTRVARAVHIVHRKADIHARTE